MDIQETTVPQHPDVEVVNGYPGLQFALVQHDLEHVDAIADTAQSADYLLVEAVGGTKDQRTEIQNALNLLTHAEVEPDFAAPHESSFLVALARELYGSGKLVLLIDTAEDDGDGAAKLIDLEDRVDDFVSDNNSLGMLAQATDALREHKMADQIADYYRRIKSKDPDASVMTIIGKAHDSLPELVSEQLR
jgi:hypothetical protein